MGGDNRAVVDLNRTRSRDKKPAKPDKNRQLISFPVATDITSACIRYIFSHCAAMARTVLRCLVGLWAWEPPESA